MTPLPEPQSTKRDHTLITVGVVMGILLAALLALPFLGHPHQHLQKRSASATPAQRMPIR